MRNRLATLGFVVLTALGLSAQHTALQFDGVDDYVEAFSHPYLSAFDNDAFTVEVIFRKTLDKPDQVLVAQRNRNGVFSIGLTDMGEPFTDVFGERYVAEGMIIPNEECHHLSVVYLPDFIDFYVNGNLVYQTLNNSGTDILVENEAFYFGQAYPNDATTFYGEIDDIRIFTDERTAAEIAQYTFKELPLHVTNKFMYFSFNHSFGAYYTDPYYSMSEAWRGGTQQSHHQMPKVVEGICAETLPDLESVSSACQPMPSCSATGLPANELICNGNFEQYCSFLNGIQPGWVLPEHAFQYTGASATTGGTSAAIPGSDVVNWFPKTTGVGSTTPDFFVRNGIGSQTGFNPYVPYVMPNWFAHPPTNTHNGLGNAAAGMLGENNYYEGITTTLRQNLQANKTYQFTGWFYNTMLYDVSWVLPGGTPSAQVRISYSDNAGSNVQIAGTTSIPYNLLVSNNNGWYYTTITFTTPTNLAAGINTFYIENYTLSASNYLFVDDVSLKEIQPTAFPQHINTGKNNDSFHRRLKVDANDNVYAAGKVSNNSPALEFGLPVSASYPLTTNRRGSFLAKYSSGGNLVWSRFIDNLLINDFEIMPNGNLFIVGETEALDPGASHTTVINWVQTVPTITLPICPGGTPVQVDHTNSPNLFIMQVNATTGQNMGTIDGFGGLGSESGQEVEIIGNTAYIAANVGSHTFQVQGAGQQCSSTQGGDLDWHPIFTPIGEHRILTYDLTTGTRNWFANTNANSTTSRLEMLGTHNTDLVILRENGIQSLNTSSPSNSPSPLVSLTADYMHVTDNGHIYLIMEGYTYTHHRLERRLTTSMSTIDAVASYQYRDAGYNWLAHNRPLSVCSKGSDVYLLGQYVDNTNGNNIFEHYVEKLDFAPSANFGDVVWSVQSAGTNARFPAYMSAGDWVITEGAPFNTISGLAVTANYTSDATSWQLSLPPKSLAANNGSLQSHTFVAKIADNGSIGQYNKKDSDGLNDRGFKIYPNPAHTFVTIESTQPIQQIDLLTVNGQLLITQEVNNLDAVILPFQDLASGIYLLLVTTAQGKEVQKLRIE